MSKYAAAKIYKITSPQTDRVYIGSTTLPLSTRISCHRSAHKTYLAGLRRATTSSELLRFDDAIIELVEACPCETVEELRRRERHWIETTPNCVNRNIPGRTNAEYARDNRDAILAYKKAHYEANKPAILDERKAHYAANAEAIRARFAQRVTCTCGATVTYGSHARHRQSKKHRAATVEPVAVEPAAEVAAVA